MPIVAGLGISQTLAWASSYYLIAILAPAMGRDAGSSSTAVLGAFSAALLISALMGPWVGRTIDRLGGREVLAVSNLVFALGLGLLALASSFPVLALGWVVMGLGMGLGLYDAAFAALGRIYGHAARASITGITLVAGFASTIGWPLTAWGEVALGWRGTCLAWAIAHLFVGLPLNLLVLPRLRGAAAPSAELAKPHVPMDRAMWLLGFAFAAGWVVSTAMAAHLPRLLEAAGASAAEAIAAAALVGPAQVAARMLEAGVLSRYHPLVSARLSTLTHPIGAGLLLMGGGWLAIPFTLLHGAGNGILTIARGTVPLAVFGSKNYGYRLGLIGAPARILQAGAPIAFGVL
ncbi:MAG TPA: MFS transporter, partial [Hyphomicrobiaceae bacterium]|nr:MFS transporter [Hyphomicrobiaceae bacterium]